MDPSTSNVFFISTGSSDFYTENTRAEFKNNLPQTINSNNKPMLMSIENVFFDKTFKTYSNNSSVPDIIISNQTINRKFFLQNVTSIQDLAEKISNFIIDFTVTAKIHKSPISVKVQDSRLSITFKYGVVLFSKTFYDFLKFDNALNVLTVLDIEMVTMFKNLDFTEFKTYNSVDNITLNTNSIDYVNLSCENIESYTSSSKNSKIVCKIPIQNFIPLQTVFHEPYQKHFFRLDCSHLQSVKFTFTQPNGEKLFFNDGSPNIIKTKMTSNASDFFYVSVSSESTQTYPDNTQSRFQVELTKEIALDGEWCVSLMDVYLPKPINIISFDRDLFTIPMEENYFCVSFYDSNDIICKIPPLSTFSKRELAIFLSREFNEYFTVYINQNESFVFTMKSEQDKRRKCHIFTSQKISNIINSSNILTFFPKHFDGERFREKFQSVNAKLIAKKLNENVLCGAIIRQSYEEFSINHREFMMFSAHDFYNIENINNVLYAFVDWRRFHKIREEWYVKNEERRLLSLFQSNINNMKTEILPSFLFIYCDFVKESMFADKYINILKLIPYKNGSNASPGGLFNSKSNDKYLVNKSRIKNLEFQILTHSGNNYPFFNKTENVMLTLKFEKRR